jgi:glucose/arabinose dehydrogenase
MKKPAAIIGIMLALVGLGAGAYYWPNLRGPGPAVLAPPRDMGKVLEKGKEDAVDAAAFPLKLPPGFSIGIFARGLPGARVLALDPGGHLLVSLTSQGRVVALPDKNGDGVADGVVTVLDGLNQPHGLAFEPGKEPRLFVAETDQVAAYDYDPERLTATYQQKIVDLPSGGRHFTRSLVFLPSSRDHRLLISVGSSCDACEESDPRRAKILAVDVEAGGDPETFASGLRNSLFMAVHPRSKHVWATETGRDDLGDNWPPDEINIILEGSHYGWPYCYGKRLHDEKSDPAGEHREFCQGTIPSFIDVPAHSAPLGLAFFPPEWPQDFRHDLLVAFGSWNRAEPTGYKVVRYKLDAAGNFIDVEDFITGWLTPAGALGRPVDILITDDGVIYISDDKAGVVYRVVFGKR